MGTLVSARNALFEQLVTDVDYWSRYLTKTALEPLPAGAAPEVRWAFERLREVASSDRDRRALEVVTRDTLFGLIHSVLVAIDGGSKLSDTVKLDLVTEDGAPLGPALHEFFMEYLVATNREPVSASEDDP